MTLGRALGMVYGEVTYGNSIFEDPARPGYTDIPRMKGLLNPSNSGASVRIHEPDRSQSECGLPRQAKLLPGLYGEVHQAGQQQCLSCE